MQKGKEGLQPSRTLNVKNLDGTSCVGTAECLKRWQQHVHGVLNVQSSFKADVSDRMRQRPMREDMGNDISMEELNIAMDTLKTKKAGGRNGVLPEMVKWGGSEEEVLKLMNSVWNGQGGLAVWRNAISVPVPKKGDLSICDNSRGVALLDVWGKVFARVVQGRLRVVGEENLSDSQCGFRKHWGTIDMVFSAKQLVEKTREHVSKGFLVFVDQKKAYDSVPRKNMWKVLSKYGIPDKMVEKNWGLHERMEAQV